MDHGGHPRTGLFHEPSPRDLGVDRLPQALFAPAEQAPNGLRDRATRLGTKPMGLDAAKSGGTHEPPAQLEQVTVLGRGTRRLAIDHENFDVSKARAGGSRDVDRLADEEHVLVLTRTDSPRGALFDMELNCAHAPFERRASG